MNIRTATEGDHDVVRALVDSYNQEFWRRPFPAAPIPDDWLREGRLLLAEEGGDVVGLARGELRQGLGRVSLVYVDAKRRRSGIGTALLRELLEFFREHDVTHVSLGVDTTNDDAHAVWRHLGFVEYQREMAAELATVDARLGGDDGGESYGSVHVQSDDQGAIADALERFVPRLFRSPASVVAAPNHGWVAVYNEVASHEPDRLRRLASELSHITGGVVLALGVEHGAVVRTLAFERGRLMDEYLSDPEHYGPLPPGDAVALRANPRVLGRLTGADMEAVRRAAPSSGELPPPAEHLEQLAIVLGIEGVGLDAREAAGLPGAITVEHP
jgi:ribosomal protein S18 acetylase RimI-like enzyme